MDLPSAEEIKKLKLPKLTDLCRACDIDTKGLKLKQDKIDALIAYQESRTAGGGDSAAAQQHTTTTEGAEAAASTEMGAAYKLGETAEDMNVENTEADDATDKAMEESEAAKPVEMEEAKAVEMEESRPDETEEAKAADAKDAKPAEADAKPAATTEAEKKLEEEAAKKAEEDATPKDFSARREEYGGDEWERMELCEAWKPLPLLRLCVPSDKTEEDVRKMCEPLLEAKGASVKSITLDKEAAVDGFMQVYMRLVANELPWKQDPETWPEDVEIRKLLGADVFAVSSQAAKILREGNIKFGEKDLTVSSGHHKVLLSVTNLPEEWSTDEAFETAMLEYGKLERCGIVKNPAGLSKGYAVVEFCLPSAAKTAKDKLDEMTQAALKAQKDARAASRRATAAKEEASKAEAPAAKEEADASRAEETKEEEKTEDKAEAATEVAVADVATDETKVVVTKSEVTGMPTYKAMRAEWAKMDNVPDVWSRTLHVANLNPGFKSDADLKAIFSEYGPVGHCRVATSKHNNDALCYAFVGFERADHCDAAYRDCDAKTFNEVGTLVICFVNPCKYSEARNTRHVVGPGGRGRGAGRGRFDPARGRGGRYDGSFAAGRGRGDYAARGAYMSPGRGSYGRGRGEAMSGRYGAYQGRGLGRGMVGYVGGGNRGFSSPGGRGEGRGYGRVGGGFGRVGGSYGGGFGGTPQSSYGSGRGFQGGQGGDYQSPPQNVGYRQQHGGGGGSGYVQQQQPVYQQAPAYQPSNQAYMGQQQATQVYPQQEYQQQQQPVAFQPAPTYQTTYAQPAQNTGYQPQQQQQPTAGYTAGYQQGFQLGGHGQPQQQQQVMGNKRVADAHQGYYTGSGQDGYADKRPRY